MKRIYIFCAQGVSTSILVNCMKRYISQEGYNYEVYAYPILKINELGKYADYIFIAPQIKHDLYRNNKDVCFFIIKQASLFLIKCHILVF